MMNIRQGKAGDGSPRAKPLSFCLRVRKANETPGFASDVLAETRPCPNVPADHLMIVARTEFS